MVGTTLMTLLLTYGGSNNVSAAEVTNAFIELEEVTVTGPQARNGAQFQVNSNVTLFTGSVGTLQRGVLTSGNRIRVENVNPQGNNRISVTVTTGPLSGLTGFIAAPQFSTMTHVGGPAF